LKYFDLPDVMAAVAPRPVIVSGTVNPLGQSMRPEDVRKEYARVSATFQNAGARNAFRIVERGENDDSFLALLKNKAQ
jgi:hypothetical protein